MSASDQNTSHLDYQIIPRVLIFAVRGEELLLIRGAESKRNWPGLYNGIGGHIEPGEDILTAAFREFLEETGLDLKQPALCGIVTIDTGKNPGIAMFIFRTNDSQGTPHSSSEGTPEWVSLNSISNLPVVEDLPELIPKILSWRHENPPFFGQYTYNDNNELVMRFSQ